MEKSWGDMMREWREKEDHGEGKWEEKGDDKGVGKEGSRWEDGEGKGKGRKESDSWLGKDDDGVFIFSLFLFFLFVVAFWAKAQALEFMQSNFWVPS